MHPGSIFKVTSRIRRVKILQMPPLRTLKLAPWITLSARAAATETSKTSQNSCYCHDLSSEKILGGVCFSKSQVSNSRTGVSVSVWMYAPLISARKARNMGLCHFQILKYGWLCLMT